MNPSSISFGSTLYNKDLELYGKNSERYPLTMLSDAQSSELAKLTANIGEVNDILVLTSKTENSEMAKFHTVYGEYFSHDPKKHAGAITLFTERKWAKEPYNAQEEVFKTAKEALAIIKEKVSQVNFNGQAKKVVLRKLS